ncbi:MAG: hypothetical protein M1831_004618 [Alyxoria varia]|nr:MAG: hypothetical protein M1831_004618 [Alyxoria varia]
MAEPPAKRRRRSDTHEEGSRSKVNGASKPSKSSRRDNGKHGDRADWHGLPRHTETSSRRSRSRSQDRRRHRSQDRTREREKDPPKDDRHRSRKGEANTADFPNHDYNSSELTLPDESPRGQKPRSRSRSPSERDRKPTRQRTPPRGPRGDRDRSRERDRRDRYETKDTAASHSRKSDRKSNAASTRPPPESVASGKAQPDGGDDDVGMTDEDREIKAMRKVMGFNNFRSTKNTKVPGNDKLYAVRKESKTEYRQYMNRQGGFNRPLSPS